ncbi:tetratricopeptide repeat protein [Sphingomonas sp. LY54]|uniref:tetratricopeptide repeat protein n=1 Tax=Sphingomonas sp. LY54 TaxID=3095343 RepID=UPI002D777C66|nr:tetratricopeptide repeat protein [Sphingomonas sp. LY54]WRP28748.1 tetratricopeptide repeat protein [Sphingomonas sp. LY54]
MIVPAGAAHASREDLAVMSAYAQARAADNAGEAGRAAQGYAAALALMPDNDVLAARVLTQALQAGNRPLAVRAARRLEKSGALAPDARLLLFGEALAARNWKAARLQADGIAADEIFAFMTPVLNAWLAVESRKGDPLAILDAAKENPLAAAYAAEHRPFILIARGDEPQGVAELLATAPGSGGRASRLRIAGAAELARKGKRDAALLLLQGDDEPVVAARRLLDARKPIPGAIGGAETGVAEFLVRIAIDLNRQDVAPLALAFARLATFLAPDNSETWIVTSQLLGARDQQAEGLAVLANVPAGDPFAGSVEDHRIALLVDAGNKEQALAEAQRAVAGPSPTAADWTRLGDLNNQLKRLDEAAAAYGKALALVESGEAGQQAWTLHLLRGGALEQAGKWPEAKAALEAAYKLAPQQPIVLNYLGYAQLERRENIDEAMKLIALASRMQPDSAEITDSLGWAHYLRGNLPEAITLLERAVEGQPADPAINEHLGDAYYSAGRRYEARYAWEAALLHAEEEGDAGRLRAKIQAGLTPKLASP